MVISLKSKGFEEYLLEAFCRNPASSQEPELQFPDSLKD